MVICLLLFAGLLTDVYGIYLSHVRKSNFASFNIFLLVETMCLYSFLWLAIERSLPRKFITLLGLIFSAIWLYYVFTKGFTTYFENCINLENISVLAFIIYYYYEKVIALNVSNLYAYSRFWIATAYFIFIAGTFFLILYIPTLTEEEKKNFYLLNYLFIIIRTTLLCVAMIKKPGSEKEGMTLQFPA